MDVCRTAGSRYRGVLGNRFALLLPPSPKQRGKGANLAGVRQRFSAGQINAGTKKKHANYCQLAMGAFEFGLPVDQGRWKKNKVLMKMEFC